MCIFVVRIFYVAKSISFVSPCKIMTIGERMVAFGYASVELSINENFPKYNLCV